MSKLDFLENTVISALMEMTTVVPKTIPGVREYRASGLPFCPIYTLLYDREPPSYSMTHYTEIGKAMHLTVQNWLSLTKHTSRIMYGSWRCTACKQVKLNQMHPVKPCPCSGEVSTDDYNRGIAKYWEYVEIEAEYNGLKLHTDLVLMPEPNFAILTDFKTTSMEKKKSSYWYNPATDHAKPSSPSYVVQQRTYATVLELQHKLPIKGWCLVNLDRAQPIKSPKDIQIISSQWSTEKTMKWKRKLDASAKNNKLLVKLEKAIDKGDRKEAKYLLEKIVAARPCTTEKEYDGWMKYKFFKGGCPLKEPCTCGTDKDVIDNVKMLLSIKG